MYKNISLALMAFLLAMNKAYGGSVAKVALEQMLNADFIADSTSRHGRVTYSDGMTTIGAGEESMPRETWEPRDDLLVVAESAGSATCRTSKIDTAFCKVSFKVLVETNGLTGLNSSGIPARRLIVLNKPKKVVMHYRLIRRSNTWLVVDPPIPFVSIHLLAKKLLTEASEATEILASTAHVNGDWELGRKRWIAYYLEEANKLSRILQPD